jgi:hypothetical protein
MENIKNYIEREQALEALNLYSAWLNSDNDEILLESYNRNRPHKKTIWSRLGNGIKTVFSGIGILIGLAARKIYNWMFNTSKERKEKNGGVWPGFTEKTKQKLQNKKVFNVNLVNVISFDSKKSSFKSLEELLELTSSDSDSYGFGDYKNEIDKIINDKKKYNIDKDDLKFCYIIYGDSKNPEYLGLCCLSTKPVTTDAVPDRYMPVIFGLKFANDFKDLDIPESVLTEILQKICKDLQKHVKEIKTKMAFDKGLAIQFLDNNFGDNVKTNCDLEKSKDGFWLYNFIEEDTKADESLNEELDAENLMWKLDKWFEDRAEERQVFYEMIAKYNQTVDVKNLAKDIKDTKFEETLKEFVNFMYDDFDFSTEKDYLYQLKKIIEYIKGKKVDLN